MKMSYFFSIPHLQHNTDISIMSSFDDTTNLRSAMNIEGVVPEALHQNHGSDITEADQEVLLMGTHLQHGNSFQRLTSMVKERKHKTTYSVYISEILYIDHTIQPKPFHNS